MLGLACKESCTTVKPVLSGHSQRSSKMVFKTYYSLMEVKIIAECSKRHSTILLTFIKLPFVIKVFVMSILSGRFRQVLLYIFYFSFKDNGIQNGVEPD